MVGAGNDTKKNRSDSSIAQLFTEHANTFGAKFFILAYLSHVRLIFSSVIL